MVQQSVASLADIGDAAIATHCIAAQSVQGVRTAMPHH
jgi:hypothetical protein